LSRPRLRADLTPLRTSRDFRLLYASRTVTALGTDATEVALLVQARQLTGSTVAVGCLARWNCCRWRCLACTAGCSRTGSTAAG